MRLGLLQLNALYILKEYEHVPSNVDPGLMGRTHMAYPTAGKAGGQMHGFPEVRPVTFDRYGDEVEGQGTATAINLTGPVRVHKIIF